MTEKRDPPDIEALFADGEAIDAALRKGVRDALLMHKRAGNPIASWKNGRVVWIAPEDIPVEDPREKRTRRAPGKARKRKR